MLRLRKFGSKFLTRLTRLEGELETQLPELNKKFIYAMLIGYSSYILIRLIGFINPETAYTMDIVFYWIYFLIVLLIIIFTR